MRPAGSIRAVSLALCVRGGPCVMTRWIEAMRDSTLHAQVDPVCVGVDSHHRTSDARS